jgi:hypothetical protein
MPVQPVTQAEWLAFESNRILEQELKDPASVTVHDWVSATIIANAGFTVLDYRNVLEGRWPDFSLDVDSPFGMTCQEADILQAEMWQIAAKGNAIIDAFNQIFSVTGSPVMDIPAIRTTRVVGELIVVEDHS